jgi:hypothetical protein
VCECEQGDGERKKTKEIFRDWFLDSDRTFELRKGNPQITEAKARRRRRINGGKGSSRSTRGIKSNGVKEKRENKPAMDQIRDETPRAKTHKENVSWGRGGDWFFFFMGRSG